MSLLQIHEHSRHVTTLAASIRGHVAALAGTRSRLGVARNMYRRHKSPILGAGTANDPTKGQERTRLSWREGLFLVGPDPLTSPYYSSGALLVAGVGYATPAFQIGLYLLLFLLAPLYIEAVLLTLSNGGTYVMTRYSLSHLGKLAVVAAALVGIIISFSYVATAIVSLLSYSNYVQSLAARIDGPHTLYAIILSAIPSMSFGFWVMPSQKRRIAIAVGITSFMALVLSTVMSSSSVVMLAPLMMLFLLNNEGLKESVKVSRTIFLINLVVMGVTIVISIVYLMMHGANVHAFVDGAEISNAVAAAPPPPHGHTEIPTFLPGFAAIGAPLLLAGVGTSILGASGVESVMNIPEELERPRSDIRLIYRWMLTALLVIGGSLSLLLFLVLSPEQLATNAQYLLAVLGYQSFLGVTGSESLAELWQTVIVANAALMLIGATNTGFAGARGLWLTMARDNLLPRAVLTPNSRGAFQRIHWMMLGAIFLVAMEAEWSLEKLERWYGATFGLVMFSGMVAFILLRRYKADDRRVYTAPFNVQIAGVSIPIGALIGVVVLGYALLSMYASFSGDFGELQRLVTLVGVTLGVVLLLRHHRRLLRLGWFYLRHVLDTVESTEIDIEDRTVVVAVGGVRIGRLLHKTIQLAGRQSSASGIQYRQMVVFHVTDRVNTELVYQVSNDSVRPAAIDGSSVRIFTRLTELAEQAPDHLRIYLALVPPKGGRSDNLATVLDTLVAFHETHEFKGHMVVVGDHENKPEAFASFQERIPESTLVPIPLYGDDAE